MQSHTSRFLVAAALHAACLTGCASTSADKTISPRPSIEIPFTLTTQNNIVVDARINGSERLRLMLHTASTEVSLTEDTVRRLSSVGFDGTTAIQSWGGSSDARHSAGNRVEIGEISRADVTIWEDMQSGEGTDGKFGLDHFGATIVEIDFDSNRIVVHDTLPNKAARYEALDLENANGEWFVHGICHFADTERTNRFLIHSGYAGGLLLEDAFAASTARSRSSTPRN